MERIRFWVRKTFGFSQKETNGFIILSSLIILVLFLPSLFNQFFNSDKTVFANDQLLLDSLIQYWKTSAIKKNRQEIPLAACISFDPNQADEQTLQRYLGNQVSENIIKYRKKGGRFYSTEQLRKIYGMTDTLYQSIRQCIVISNESKKSQTETITQFDINKVDSLELQKIKGIGKVLSSRIIRFRERLGGFVSLDQLKEVYGLDSLVAKELISKSFIRKDFTPSRINLNYTEASYLYSHPYIGKDAAKKIVALRKEKGKITLSNIKSSVIFSSVKLQQVIPYVEF